MPSRMEGLRVFIVVLQLFLQSITQSVIDGGQDSAREASGKFLASLHISLAQVLLLLYWCCIYCGCSFCREGCLPTSLSQSSGTIRDSVRRQCWLWRLTQRQIHQPGTTPALSVVSGDSGSVQSAESMVDPPVMTFEEKVQFQVDCTLGCFPEDERSCKL